jgi:hypothetical protein
VGWPALAWGESALAIVNRLALSFCMAAKLSVFLARAARDSVMPLEAGLGV